MQLDIVVLLIFLNGVFAMAEIAIISARKTKLQKEANEGNRKAQMALRLAQSPNEFLSTIQIGITFFSILAGTFGGGLFAKNIASLLNKVPFLASFSEPISLGIVISLMTFAYLVLGEIVPKRLALNNPETIAKIVVIPMQFLSRAATPLVWLLSSATNIVLMLFQIKDDISNPITEEEVRLLINEGEKAGIFAPVERDMVERSLNLSSKKVSTLMTVRKEIVWLDFDSSSSLIKNKVIKRPFSHFPVCRDSIDKIIGIVRTEDIIPDLLLEKNVDLKRILHKPLFIPESIDCLSVLEIFKSSKVHVGIVIDEYGNIQGLITFSDLLSALVGNNTSVSNHIEKEIVRRKDGTFLVDGLITIDVFKEHFRFSNTKFNKYREFHTLGGMVTHKIGRVPITGDCFELEEMRFEVVDMDGNRVDKVLVSSNKGYGLNII